MSDRTVILVARRFRTMEPSFATVEAVAVRGGRILAVGTLDQVTAAAGEDYLVDDRLRDRVVIPGLIDQHLHPLLGATTLATEVIATEDWVLPDRTHPAASSADEYRARLIAADLALDDADEWLLTWGYHELWHGHLDRAALDAVSATRPIGVWQRSCHEWFMNSVAIERLGVTAEVLAGHGAASEQFDLAGGHFWESGLLPPRDAEGRTDPRQP